MTFPYEELKTAGITTVVVEYGGHGDEGWINEITATPNEIDLSDALYEQIQQAAYDALEDNYAGWEINEGSDGTITLDVTDRKATIHHGTVVESHQWETREIFDRGGER